MSTRVHFLLISEQKEVIERVAHLSVEFHYQSKLQPTLESLMSQASDYEQVQFILLDVRSCASREEASELIKNTRRQIKETFICTLAKDTATLADCQSYKKASGNFVMLEKDFFSTSRLEYISSQVIRASFVPVKLNEFPKSSKLDFTLYHLMPLNQKLVAILPKGIELTDARLEKLDGISEVFVRRDELDHYRMYVESHPTVTSQGIQSRCRAQYLSYCNSHSQLMFYLIDEGEKDSPKEGKWLFDRCEILSRELLTTLSSVGEAWDVVNNSSLGEFGSLERAPTTAAYSGLLSLLSSIGDPTEVMVAGLLADVGMLELSPRLSEKFRHDQKVQTLFGEELKTYQDHPIKSLEMSQARNLPIKESTKDIILCTHERADGQGFPNRRSGDKIPLESMVIQFSEMIDRAAMIRMGVQAQKWPVSQVRKDLVSLEMEKFSTFSEPFVQKIKPVI